MDKEILQQLNYAEMFMNTWLRRGPSIWYFDELNSPIMTDTNIGGRNLTTEELSNYAIQAKRDARYAESIGAYVKIMNACVRATNKIPVEYARGFFKVLICVNDFLDAYSLASTVFADMQQSENVNKNEMELFQAYFSTLAKLSITVVDNNDFSMVLPYASNFSGNPNYRLERTTLEIKDDLQRIRDKLKEIYGI